MKIAIDAFRDDEAGVWVATARDPGLGLVTEAETIEDLQRKLAAMIPDLLDDRPGPYEIELFTRSLQVVAA
jgi:hypothetical protein